MPAECRDLPKKKVLHPIVGWIDEDEIKQSKSNHCIKCDFWQDDDCIADPNKVACIYMDDGIDEVYADQYNKVVEDSGGMKNDKEKPDWSLIPLETIEGIVRVLTYGAKKYARDNWKKVSINRNFAALLRHLTKWQGGEEVDPESGLHHLDHALCDLMFMKWQTVAR